MYLKNSNIATRIFLKPKHYAQTRMSMLPITEPKGAGSPAQRDMLLCTDNPEVSGYATMHRQECLCYYYTAPRKSSRLGDTTRAPALRAELRAFSSALKAIKASPKSVSSRLDIVALT